MLREAFVRIMLLDGAFIQEKDAEYYNRKHENKKPISETNIHEPLYTTDDVNDTMDLFLGLSL
jgi:metallo-beta-lactamase family protein